MKKQNKNNNNNITETYPLEKTKLMLTNRWLSGNIRKNQYQTCSPLLMYTYVVNKQEIQGDHMI